MVRLQYKSITQIFSQETGQENFIWIFMLPKLPKLPKLRELPELQNQKREKK